MNKKYTKKIVGSTIIAVFILSLSLVGFTYAQAQSQNGNNRSYKFSGEITVISDTVLTIETANESIDFELNDKTTYTRGMDRDDFVAGFDVYVIAKMVNDNYVAKVVQKDNDAGYGRDW